MNQEDVSLIQEPHFCSQQMKEAVADCVDYVHGRHSPIKSNYSRYKLQSTECAIRGRSENSTQLLLFDQKFIELIQAIEIKTNINNVRVAQIDGRLYVFKVEGNTVELHYRGYEVDQKLEKVNSVELNAQIVSMSQIVNDDSRKIVLIATLNQMHLIVVEHCRLTAIPLQSNNLVSKLFKSVQKLLSGRKEDVITWIHLDQNPLRATVFYSQQVVFLQLQLGSMMQLNVTEIGRRPLLFNGDNILQTQRCRGRVIVLVQSQREKQLWQVNHSEIIMVRLINRVESDNYMQVAYINNQIYLLTIEERGNDKWLCVDCYGKQNVERRECFGGAGVMFKGESLFLATEREILLLDSGSVRDESVSEWLDLIKIDRNLPFSQQLIPLIKRTRRVCRGRDKLLCRKDYFAKLLLKTHQPFAQTLATKFLCETTNDSFFQYLSALVLSDREQLFIQNMVGIFNTYNYEEVGETLSDWVSIALDLMSTKSPANNWPLQNLLTTVVALLPVQNRVWKLLLDAKEGHFLLQLLRRIQDKDKALSLFQVLLPSMNSSSLQEHFNAVNQGVMFEKYFDKLIDYCCSQNLLPLLAFDGQLEMQNKIMNALQSRQPRLATLYSLRINSRTENWKQIQQSALQMKNPLFSYVIAPHTDPFEKHLKTTTTLR